MIKKLLSKAAPQVKIAWAGGLMRSYVLRRGILRRLREGLVEGRRALFCWYKRS